MRKFYQLAYCLAFSLAMLHFFSPPHSRAKPVAGYPLAKWELVHNEKDFTLETRALNNPAALVRLANSFETRFVKMAATFHISLALSRQELSRFGDGNIARCVIFVDGKEYATRAVRRDSIIIIDEPAFVGALLASTHERFVIGFPALAISLTFPVAGLKQALHKVRALQTQFRAAARSESRKSFATGGSIAIIAATLTGFALFAWSLWRQKAHAEEEDDAGRTAQGTEKAQGKKARARRETGKKPQGGRHFRTEAENAYSWQSWNERETSDEKFFERANFANPFAQASAIPADVRSALKFFGLPEKTTFADARKKRNFMLKAYHPDRFENDAAARAQAEEETKLINYNFDILEKYFSR